MRQSVDRVCALSGIGADTLYDVDSGELSLNQVRSKLNALDSTLGDLNAAPPKLPTGTTANEVLSQLQHAALDAEQVLERANAVSIARS